MTSPIAATLGEGLLAGAVGTAAMTAGQAAEMRATGRAPSDTPARAAERVLGVEPVDDRAEHRLNTGAHWAYGTAWGLVAALLRRAGLPRAITVPLHLAGMWGVGLWLLPRLDVAPPARRWGAKALLVDLAHHVVYVLGAAAAVALLERSTAPPRAHVGAGPRATARVHRARPHSESHHSA